MQLSRHTMTEIAFRTGYQRIQEFRAITASTSALPQRLIGRAARNMGGWNGPPDRDCSTCDRFQGAVGGWSIFRRIGSAVAKGAWPKTWNAANIGEQGKRRRIWPVSQTYVRIRLRAEKTLAHNRSVRTGNVVPQ